MTSTPVDQILERRKLLRSVRLWRFLAFAFVIVAIMITGASIGGKNGGAIEAPYIARFTISGMITAQPETLKALDELADSKSVKGIILHVNSPGGTTSGAEVLYAKLRKVAEKKPIVAYVDHLAASGGYIVILAADHIVAQQNALVGSIGVLVQWPEFSGLMNTIGVKMEEVKSAPLKAAPNGFEPASEEARAALNAIVQDSYTWFKNLVQDRRKLEGDALKAVVDGRIFTGRQSLSLNLIDSIGQEDTAKRWLIEQHKLNSALEVEDWEMKKDWKGQFGEKIKHFSKISGLNWLSEAFYQQETLDGLVSVWNPAR